MVVLAVITSHAPSLLGFRGPLILALQERGLTVFALAPNFGYQTRTAIAALGATPIDSPMSRTGMNPLRDAWNTWHMARLLRRMQPDITLGYFVKPVIFGTLAAWWAGVPHRFAMVEGLGFVFTDTGAKRTLKRLLLRRLVLWLYKLGLARAERVIFLNPDDRDELVAAGVLPFDKAFLLGGIGVDLAQWAPAAPVADPVTFLLVARLLREKGIEQYAAAARIVKQQYPLARFILLGGLDDNPGSITQAEVQAWVAEGILEWHGHVPVQPWMAQASVYGVAVAHSDGRAGMAAVVLHPGAAFDGRAMAQDLCRALPVYAVPIFVRIIKAQETTGTFKLRKVELKRQGFDPALIHEPLFVLLDRDHGYQPLTRAIHCRILAGTVRW